MTGSASSLGTVGAEGSSIYIAVLGASKPVGTDLADAEEVGRLLGSAGATVICGGRGGVMAAVSKGCALAGGTVVGLLPGNTRADANEWVSVAITTGLGELRNGVVARSADAVIAVGGAYGTLSEIAFALQAGKPVFALHSWEIEGVVAVSSAAEAVERALGAAVGAPLMPPSSARGERSS